MPPKTLPKDNDFIKIAIVLALIVAKTNEESVKWRKPKIHSKI